MAVVAFGIGGTLLYSGGWKTVVLLQVGSGSARLCGWCGSQLTLHTKTKRPPRPSPPPHTPPPTQAAHTGRTRHRHPLPSCHHLHAFPLCPSTTPLSRKDTPHTFQTGGTHQAKRTRPSFTPTTPPHTRGLTLPFLPLPLHLLLPHKILVGLEQTNPSFGGPSTPTAKTPPPHTWA